MARSLASFAGVPGILVPMPNSIPPAPTAEETSPESPTWQSPTWQSPGKVAKPGSRHLVSAIAGGLILGLVVGVMGTMVHRQWLPWMLIAALIVSLSAALWMRSWRGIAAAGPYAAGWMVAVQVLSLPGPGGNVLITAQPSGYLWTLGGSLLVLLVLVLPRRWFIEPQPARAPINYESDGSNTNESEL